MKQHFRDRPYLLILILLLPVLTQCTLSPGLANLITPATPTVAVLVAEDKPPDVEVTIRFTAQLPQDAGSQPLYVDIFDDLNGSSHTTRHLMSPSGLNRYELSLSVPERVILKYRYTLGEDTPLIETTPADEAVNYRLYYAVSNGETSDVIAAWEGSPFAGETGRITGSVANPDGTPLPDMLVTAGGLAAVSAGDGSFTLDGVPAGLQNLAAVHMRGEALPFQQGAIVEAGKVTFAGIIVPRARKVSITFVMQPPDNRQIDHPVRLLGNLYETGYNFSAISAPESLSAARAPVLNRLADGRYAVAVSLPVGLRFQYKYSMGDGRWNCELDENALPFTRQLIVPSFDTILIDQISQWSPAGTKPLEFLVTVPEETPLNDSVSITFDAGDLSAPIPMQQVGTRQWKYTLFYSPAGGEPFEYRYSRNEQAGTAYPSVMAESFSGVIDRSGMTQTVIRDEILQWQWLAPLPQSSIVGTLVNPRGAGFIAGIELQTAFDASYLPHYSDAFENIKALSANQVILTPTWRYQTVNPPFAAAIPGLDANWGDLEAIVTEARRKSLPVALFPHTIQPVAGWDDANLDEAWRQTWFDNYRSFLLHYALFARQHDIQTLILGEPGMLPNGAGSRVTPNTEARWMGILQDIRAVYSGELVLAVEDPAALSFSNQFLDQFDRFYVLPALALDEPAEGVNSWPAVVDAYLDETVYPFWEAVQKPILLGISYPSHADAGRGCIDSAEGCLAFDILNPPLLLMPEEPPDFAIQYTIYETFLNAVNNRDWIAGFVSRGYYAPVELLDHSISVRGKPASALLWYWFSRYTLPE